VLRIVLDTNILVAIIGRKSPFRWMFDSIISGDITLCVTTDILLEYREIMEQKNGYEVAENVINFITVMPTTERIEVYFNFNLIAEDNDDNKFADCAIAAGANHLVSNDGHYATLAQLDFPKVDWITLTDFERQYKDTLTTGRQAAA
jgi:uncharacterized protein